MTRTTNGYTCPLVAASVSILSFAMVLTAPPAAAHAGNNDPSVVHACVHRDKGGDANGQVRIVPAVPADRHDNCRPREIAMHWSVAGPQGPAGPAGPIGPVGPEGPAAAIQIARRFQSPTLIQSNTSGESVAQCLPGESATGGGYSTFPVQGIFPWSVIVNTSYPSSIGGPGPDTWVVNAINNDPFGQTISLTAYIMCVAQ